MIGVVGPAPSTDELAASLDAVAGRVGEASEIVAADPTVVVAVGDEAVVDLVRAGVETPVLLVEADEALSPVSKERVEGVIDRGLATGFETRRRPVLEASLDGERSPAVFEAMLVTAEPARISEYTVDGGGWTDRFRADGVVVSTPAGSGGYARTLGGPVLDPDADGLSVVPVAPFVRRATVRVAGEAAALRVTVERDEGDVSLLVDGRSAGVVPPGVPVGIQVNGALETVVGAGSA